MGIFDGAAAANPYGFAASVAADAISTPNTSASGDINTGFKSFSTGTTGGVVFGGTGVPTWVLITGAALLAYVIFQRRK